MIDQSRHLQQMLQERGIQLKWLEQTLHDPDKKEHRPDGTMHYLKKICENENRWLRVVVNTTTEPHKGITAFFDRRLKRDSKEPQQ